MCWDGGKGVAFGIEEARTRSFGAVGRGGEMGGRCWSWGGCWMSILCMCVIIALWFSFTFRIRSVARLRSLFGAGVVACKGAGSADCGGTDVFRSFRIENRRRSERAGMASGETSIGCGEVLFSILRTRPVNVARLLSLLGSATNGAGAVSGSTSIGCGDIVLLLVRSLLPANRRHSEVDFLIKEM